MEDSQYQQLQHRFVNQCLSLQHRRQNPSSGLRRIHRLIHPRRNRRTHLHRRPRHHQKQTGEILHCRQCLHHRRLRMGKERTSGRKWRLRRLSDHQRIQLLHRRQTLRSSFEMVQPLQHPQVLQQFQYQQHPRLCRQTHRRRRLRRNFQRQLHRQSQWRCT